MISTNKVADTKKNNIALLIYEWRYSKIIHDYSLLSAVNLTQIDNNVCNIRAYNSVLSSRHIVVCKIVHA